MQHKTEQDEFLIRYLLGDLAPDQQREVEEKLFSDNQFFEELLALESTLADQYVKGKLPADQRAKFEEVLKRSAEARGEVNFAQNLMRDIAEMPAAGKKSEWASAGKARRKTFSVTAGLAAFWGRYSLPASALLALIAVGLFIWNVSLRNHLTQIETDGPGKALRAELAGERQQRQALERELARIKQSSPEMAFLSLSFSNAMINRGQGGSTSVYIAKTATQLRIEIDLNDSPRYDHYSASITTVDGQKFWDDPAIASDRIQDGKLVLLVSANRFQNNDYILKLTGWEQGNEPNDLGEYPFRVKR